MNIPRPPAHVEPYVTALGAERAVRFLLAFGGADFYIAKDPKAGSNALEVIGLDGLRALSDIRDRLQYRVPTAKNWIARYMHVVEGKSKADIARSLHTSINSVNRWLGEEAKRPFNDPRQPSLF
ncbi:MAG: helix-turn-helix domain-containing protein [Cypionkella sp.]|jgi:hypothetical protein